MVPKPPMGARCLTAGAYPCYMQSVERATDVMNIPFTRRMENTKFFIDVPILGGRVLITEGPDETVGWCI